MNVGEHVSVPQTTANSYSDQQNSIRGWICSLQTEKRLRQCRACLSSERTHRHPTSLHHQCLQTVPPEARKQVAATDSVEAPKIATTNEARCTSTTAGKLSGSVPLLLGVPRYRMLPCTTNSVLFPFLFPMCECSSSKSTFFPLHRQTIATSHLIIAVLGCRVDIELASY